MTPIEIDARTSRLIGLVFSLVALVVVLTTAILSIVYLTEPSHVLRLAISAGWAAGLMFISASYSTLPTWRVLQVVLMISLGFTLGLNLAAFMLQ